MVPIRRGDAEDQDFPKSSMSKKSVSGYRLASALTALDICSSPDSLFLLPKQLQEALF